MTTIIHDAFCELFRFDGALLKEMIGEQYGVTECSPVVGSAELTQIPSEYRADSVTLFFNANGEKQLAVIVEVQHTWQKEKRLTWPAYVAATYARHGCPTLLFVLAVDDKIAKEARASIDLGHPGFVLTPIVITREQIPHITDLQAARQFPRLAVLSALTHHSVPIAATALAILEKTSPDYVEVYRDLIVSKLSPKDQELLEATMEHYEWQSIRAKQQIAELKEESKREGLREGRVVAQQAAVIQLAKAKIKTFSAEDEARVAQLDDETKLIDLILALGRATSAAKARAALASLPSVPNPVAAPIPDSAPSPTT